MNAATIAAALGRHTSKADGGFMACCPVHDDRNPSLSITQNADGKLLVHCMAGCDNADVVAELKIRGLWPGNDKLMPPATKPPIRLTWQSITPVPDEASPPPVAHRQHDKPSMTWAYRSITGDLLQWVYRFDLPDGKQVLPLTYCTDGTKYAWRWQALPEPRPLYGLELLGDAQYVVVVEGEKTADAARRLLGEKIPVVTWPGGCNAVTKADWSPLKGRSIAIWPDNDKPGMNAAVVVADELVKVGVAALKIVVPPGNLAKTWDAADAEADGWNYGRALVLLKQGLPPKDFKAKYRQDPVESRTIAPQSTSTIEPPAYITDLKVAEFFSGSFRDKVRYWAESKKWLTYDGTRWNTDTPGGPFPYVKEMVRMLHSSARQIPNEDLRLKTLKAIISMEGHRRQETVLSAASVIPSLIVASSQLDRNSMILNCRNGTLDLATGSLQPHSHSDLITRLVNIDYLPNEPCPEFLRFLSKVLDGKKELVDYLQRFIGYCLTGKTTEQVLLFMYGTGANGKTTLANVMEALLGDFASTAGCDLLMQRDRRGATNDLAGLRGARLVKVSEFDDGERLAEATIKTLTGGDRVSCRFLYGEFFEYIPTYKIVLLGNYKPKVRGRDNGIWRRIHLLPFKVTIPEDERDPQLMDKLLSELPGILAWAVQGCIEWQKIGLSSPEEVRKEVAAYRQQEDIFAQWLDDCCALGDNHRTSASDLLSSFKEYSSWRGTSSKKFSQLLEEAGFTKEKSSHIHWRGIGLTSGTIGRIDVDSSKSREEGDTGTFTKKVFNRPDPPSSHDEPLPYVDLPIDKLQVTP